MRINSNVCGIVVAWASLLPAAGARAQGAFAEELGTDVAAIERDVDLHMSNGNGDGQESGRGPVPYYRGMGTPPKRVALLSFYAFDGGNKQRIAIVTTYRNTSMEGVDFIVNGLYDEGIAPLTEAFAAKGMQLLTPEEFLDTPEKRTIYEDYVLESNAAERFVTFLQNREELLEHSTATVPGFKLFPFVVNRNEDARDFRLMAAGAGVAKLAEQLGHDLTQKLGVDATLFVYNVVQPQRNAIALVGTYAYMFGPNPVPESGQSLYWHGHQYSGVWLKMDVPFITTNRDGEMTDSDLPGYALVARAVGNRMATHLQEKITGAP